MSKPHASTTYRYAFRGTEIPSLASKKKSPFIRVIDKVRTPVDSLGRVLARQVKTASGRSDSFFKAIEAGDFFKVRNLLIEEASKPIDSDENLTSHFLSLPQFYQNKELRAYLRSTVERRLSEVQFNPVAQEKLKRFVGNYVKGMANSGLPTAANVLSASIRQVTDLIEGGEKLAAFDLVNKKLDIYTYKHGESLRVLANLLAQTLL